MAIRTPADEQRLADHAPAAGSHAERLSRHHLAAAAAIVAGAVASWLLTRTRLTGYDTQFALAWGEQLAHGSTPDFEQPFAPTRHPLLELLGIVLAPLSAATAQAVVLALCLLALSGSLYVTYRLGATWFGAAAGVLAIALLATRASVISYAGGAYVDVPYLLLVLWALLVEARRRRAGAPVLVLLAAAGLLRPEAWIFAGLYVLWLAPGASVRELAGWVGLAAVAPVVWLGSDWLLTGSPLASLQQTERGVELYDRASGLADVPIEVPRALQSLLRPPALLGGLAGIALALAWLRPRPWPGIVACAAGVGVFAAFGAAGAPLNFRYVLAPVAVLCVFCAGAVLGWLRLPPAATGRRAWMAIGAVVGVLLVAYLPSALRGITDGLGDLRVEDRARRELSALIERERDVLASASCGPIWVPSSRPIPLIALAAGIPASDVRVRPAGDAAPAGTYVVPASTAVAAALGSDAGRPPVAVEPPAGAVRVGGDANWTIAQRC